MLLSLVCAAGEATPNFDASSSAAGEARAYGARSSPSGSYNG